MDFSSMFDACLAETSARSTPVAPSGPVIVSENHDASSINWMEALGGDPGEIIACGAYQELRKLAGESKSQYFARIPAVLAAMPENHRKIVVDAAMKAAQARFGIVTDHNGHIPLAVVQRNDGAEWHGLGTIVRDAMTADEAMSLSRMNFPVSKEACTRFNPVTGKSEVIPGRFWVVRDDTGERLSDNVGKIYKVLQNADGFRVLDAARGQFGAQYEAAGSLYGGKVVFCTISLPNQDFAVGGKDKVQTYATFTNPHTGKKGWEMFVHTTRAACANRLRIATMEGKKTGKHARGRHTGDMGLKLEEATRLLGIAVEKVDEFHGQAEALKATRVEPVAFFNGILDTVCDVTEAGAVMAGNPLAAALKATDVEQRLLAEKKLARDFGKRRNLLDELLTRHESETNRVNGMQATGWGVVNVISEAVNHGNGLGGFQRGEHKASARYENIMTGNGDAIMQTAMANALALVG